MKNSNRAKNQQTADTQNRREEGNPANTAAQPIERNKKEDDKAQVSSYGYSRGYYSRNGGANGYRGL